MSVLHIKAQNAVGRPQATALPHFALLLRHFALLLRSTEPLLRSMTQTDADMLKKTSEDAGGAGSTAGPAAPPSVYPLPPYSLPPPGGFPGPPPGFVAPPGNERSPTPYSLPPPPGLLAPPPGFVAPPGGVHQGNNPSASHLGNEPNAMMGYPPTYPAPPYLAPHSQYHHPYTYYGNAYHPQFTGGPHPGVHPAAYHPSPYPGPPVKTEPLPPSPYLGLGQALGPASRDRTPSGPPPHFPQPATSFQSAEQHPASASSAQGTGPSPPPPSPPPPPAVASSHNAPPPMTYSLRKTITPRKGDDSAETQRLRKMREARMSVQPRSSQQGSKDQEQVDILMDLPQSVLLSCATDAGCLPPPAPSNLPPPTSSNLPPPASSNLPPPTSSNLPPPTSSNPPPPASSNPPLPASSNPPPPTSSNLLPPASSNRHTDTPPSKQSSRWHTGNITKNDLKDYGLEPPSFQTPSKKPGNNDGGPSTSRSQSAIPPSTPQRRSTPMRAASAEPSTPRPTADAFRLMGTESGSPLRAFQRIIGVASANDDSSAPSLPSAPSAPAPPSDHSAPSGPSSPAGTSESFKVGALTKEERRIVQEVAKDALKMLTDASTKINRPLNVLVHVLNKLIGSKVTYSRSLWNYWVSYFWRHCREERERVGNPNAQPSDNFESFQEEFPEWEELIIADFHRAAAVEVETIGERERSFQKWFSNMVDLAARGEEIHGFQSMIMACGESVNEDQAIGQLHLSKNLEDDFLKERLLMMEDALLGQMKIHSYDYVAKDYAKQLAEDREAREEEQKLEAELCSEDGSDSNGDDNDNDFDTQDFLKKVEKLADKTLTKRIRQLLAMDDPAVSKVNTDNGRKIIRDYFQAGFRVGGGRMESVNLRWGDLPTRLAGQGLAIVGWAHKVPFPDKDSKPDGIKSIKVEGIRKLVFGFRDGKIRMEHRDVKKLQDCLLPVAVEEAPPADSKQVAARRWFADGTSDYKGTPRISAPKAESSRSSTTASRTNRPSTRSVTFNIPPKPTARSSKSSKGKGKQKPSVVVSDTDDDLPLAPTQPPPPTKSRPKGDPKVEKIRVKVGNVEVPVPFVDNSDDDVFELTSDDNDTPSPTKRTSKRRHSLLSPPIESDNESIVTLTKGEQKQDPSAASSSLSGPNPAGSESKQDATTGGQRVKPRPRKRLMVTKDTGKEQNVQELEHSQVPPAVPSASTPAQSVSTSAIPLSAPGLLDAGSTSAAFHPPAASVPDPASLQSAYAHHPSSTANAPHPHQAGYPYYWQQHANYNPPPPMHGPGSGQPPAPINYSLPPPVPGQGGGHPPPTYYPYPHHTAGAFGGERAPGTEDGAK
ncbi:hypothetical protein EST38_g9186 [Candolleomyces aberdarensis]|uniref:Uncharacterized protein n=1 Tax=Candolleomyces aberdarensis TaxID=2316362 RepID=A0A4Q2DCC2_9AGAR|nr:hypothetical protein EST38_g9186 [Candolleomyces aberdarensis]